MARRRRQTAMTAEDVDDISDDVSGRLTPKFVFLCQISIAAMTIIAYAALTIAGHDATPLAALLAGQGIGATVQSKA